ncbi:MAG: RadC family protein [Clostridia bacterium]|nr:RadC family protein [Clostridia bacterium]
MSEKTKNPHDGHRQRMREQFLKANGLDSFPDHNVLEMLLFYSISRADTNELAHRLIDTFGSLNGVFDAPYSALKDVKGVGEQTAVLIKLIPSLVKKYLEGSVSDKNHIQTTEDAVEYLRPKFATLKNEELIMVCMNNAGKILNSTVISKGGSDFAEVDTRKIVQEVISSNATQVIIAHNHPGGICAPSSADVKITNNISALLHSINARLANHIIITDTDYFSFAATPKYASLFIAEPLTEQDVAEV